MRGESLNFFVPATTLKFFRVIQLDNHRRIATDARAKGDGVILR